MKCMDAKGTQMKQRTIRRMWVCTILFWTLLEIGIFIGDRQWNGKNISYRSDIHFHPQLFILTRF